jgi:hypothetical protein
MYLQKSIFNLADDEVLTHRGQTLSEIEKFDDPRSDDEEEEEGRGMLGCKCLDYSVSNVIIIGYVGCAWIIEHCCMQCYHRTCRVEDCKSIVR